MAGQFALTKWYLDCVSADGEVLVLYATQLRAGSLRLRYASTLLSVDGCAAIERISLSATRLPVESDGMVTWAHRGLELEGRWRSDAGAIERTLLEERGGRLEWRCTQPIAAAEIALGGRVFHGTGYTERLVLTIAPWRLPIEELRWGRAHAGGRSAVWIDWKGPRPARLVFLDGREVEGTFVDDTAVRAPGFTLSLARPRALRLGPLAGTAAGAIPGVRQLMSATGLLLEERKWLSDATLEAGGVTTTGRAIHEAVRWR